MPKAVDLSREELAFLREIFSRYAPKREVWLFGSRVSGRARPFSDLDVMILGERPIDDLTMADLRDAFIESSLRFKVDLVEWASTGESFRRIVKTDHVPLAEAESAENV